MIWALLSVMAVLALLLAPFRLRLRMLTWAILILVLLVGAIAIVEAILLRSVIWPL